MSDPQLTFDEARDIVLRHMARRSAPEGSSWATFPEGAEDDRSFAVGCNNARAVASGEPRDLYPGMPVFLVDKVTGQVEEAHYQTTRERLDAMTPVTSGQNPAAR